MIDMWLWSRQVEKLLTDSDTNSQ